MEDKDYLAFLERYAQGRYTEEEHSRFLNWFGSLPGQEARHVMDRYAEIMEKYGAVLSQPYSPFLVDRIEAALDRLDEARRKPEKQLRPVWSLWKYAAAAVIVIGMYFSYSAYSDRAEESAVHQTVREEDVSPGGDRAILTLADGSSIELSEAGSGEIAKQAGVSVKKAEEGELVYQKTEANGRMAGKEAIGALFNTVRTPKGGKYRINLPDGTKVWLNSLSSLRFPIAFDKNARMVEVTGEAYFEVATVRAWGGAGKRIPFRVISNRQTIEVTGTRFNVSTYTDEGEIRTTLLEGSVNVREQQSGQKVSLKPGEQAVLVTSGQGSPARQTPVITVRQADVEGAVAWKEGYFKFRDTGIREVMRQLARWYDIDIVYKGAPSQDRFTGFVARDVKLSNVLQMLEEGSDVRFKVSGKSVEVSFADMQNNFE